MNKPYFCRYVFLTDWRHKRLKNKIDLLLFYREHFYVFSVSAMPCETASKEKWQHTHNIEKTHIHTFGNRFPGSRYHSGVAVSELWRFNQNSEGAVALIRAKVTLTKKLGIKSRYIRNSNGLPILALELWRKTKQWYKKYDKYQFCTQRLLNNSIIT